MFFFQSTGRSRQFLALCGSFWKAEQLGGHATTERLLLRFGLARADSPLTATCCRATFVRPMSALGRKRTLLNVRNGGKRTSTGADTCKRAGSAADVECPLYRRKQVDGNASQRSLQWSKLVSTSPCASALRRSSRRSRARRRRGRARQRRSDNRSAGSRLPPPHGCRRRARCRRASGRRRRTRREWRDARPSG